MEEILEHEGKDENDTTWVSTKLKPFLVANTDATGASTISIGGKYGEEKKKKFLRLLFNAGPKLTNLDILTVLKAIKIAFREKPGTEDFSNPNTFKFLLSLTSHSSPAVREEAAKCIANLLITNKPDSEQPFLDAGGGDWLVTTIKDQSQENKSPGFLQGLSHILIHLIDLSDEKQKELPPSTSSASSTDQEGPTTPKAAQPPPISPFKELLIAHDVLEVYTQNLEEELKIPEFWKIRQPIVVCYLKILFPMTMHLGPLNGTQALPTERETAIWKRLVPILEHCLSITPVETNPPPELNRAINQIKNSAVNLLINTPSSIAPLFKATVVLNSLIEILKTILADEANPGLVELTSLLIVLNTIARDVPKARAILKNLVFPETVPESENGKIPIQGPTDQNTIAGKLVKYMSAGASGAGGYPLQYYTAEFCFQLCGQDPQEFIARTGFGNAAGLLAMRGLFK